MAYLTDKQKVNFTKRIETKTETDCWDWNSITDRYGYGDFRYMVGGKIQYKIAHRIALELTGVDIKGKLVLHSCDNRKCCNPAHLRTGTQQENMNDMVARGRSCKGRPKKQKPIFKIEHTRSEETMKFHEERTDDAFIPIQQNEVQARS